MLPAHGLLDGFPSAGELIERSRWKLGHPYFPMVPGAFSDFRVTRLGEGTRYIRVAFGRPEAFFGRTATPWVYGEIPGLVRDTTLFGLRQYFSRSPNGDLWFHGAQNNGFMSHTEPPVRQLLASPAPGQAWSDTVLFESFFPGFILFFRDNYRYEWTLSPRARLPLPAGVFEAIRATSVLWSVEPPGPVPLAAVPSDDRDVSIWDRLGMVGRPGQVDVLKGFWFARHVGIVARDWPSGEGVTNTNILTFELLRQGMGPVPPPAPPIGIGPQ